MKRIILIMGIMALNMAMLLAAVSAPDGVSQGIATSPENGDSVPVSAYAKATFNMSDQDSYVVVGFIGEANNAPKSVSEDMSSKDVSDVTLAADSSTGTANNLNDYLGVFWQIQSKDELKVAVYPYEDLKKSDEASWTDGTTLLGWQIGVLDDATAPTEDSNATNVAKSPKYQGQSAQTSTKAEVFSHDGTTFGSYGAKALLVKTSDYAQNKTGSYEGYIVAEISTDNTGN